jgi:hypothetical protein
MPAGIRFRFPISHSNVPLTIPTSDVFQSLTSGEATQMSDLLPSPSTLVSSSVPYSGVRHVTYGGKMESSLIYCCDLQLNNPLRRENILTGSSLNGLPSSHLSRRIAWNATLFVGGIFGIAAAAAPNFVVFCTMIALIGMCECSYAAAISRNELAYLELVCG